TITTLYHLHPHPFPTRRSSDLFTQTNRTPTCWTSSSHRLPFSSTTRYGALSSGCKRYRRCHRISPARTRQLRFASIRADSSSTRSEEHTSELQSRSDLVCRLLL